jgi:2-methylcitrate dehydratase PrpD
VEYNQSRANRAGKVEIRTKDGKVYSKRTDFPYGHPKNPLAYEDIVNKFRDCLSYAAKPVARDNVEKVIDMVRKLEDVEDVGQIINLLA